MSDYIQLRQQNFSFLGKDCKLVGRFEFFGVTRFASQLEGELQMSSHSTLTVEREGKFSGVIDCFDLEVFGSIEGEIRSKGTVIFYSSSKFIGKIMAQGLKIYPGAQVNMDGHTIEGTL